MSRRTTQFMSGGLTGSRYKNSSRSPHNVVKISQWNTHYRRSQRRSMKSSKTSHPKKTRNVSSGHIYNSTGSVKLSNLVGEYRQTHYAGGHIVPSAHSTHRTVRHTYSIVNTVQYELTAPSKTWKNDFSNILASLLVAASASGLAILL